MRCSIARTARASNAPRCRPLFPDWDRACSAHLEGNRRGALDPNSPDFTGAARQHLPTDAGPRGFMPREQCEASFASSDDVEGLRHHRTFSTMSELSPFHRSDACRAGRCLHIPKLRSSSKPSRMETRRSVTRLEEGRIDFFWRKRFQAFALKTAGIEGCSIPRKRRRRHHVRTAGALAGMINRAQTPSSARSTHHLLPARAPAVRALWRVASSTMRRPVSASAPCLLGLAPGAMFRAWPSR